MRRAGGSRGREWAQNVIAAGRTSVGVTGIAPELRRQIKRLVQRYEATFADKETVESEIRALIEQYPKRSGTAERGWSQFAYDGRNTG